MSLSLSLTLSFSVSISVSVSVSHYKYLFSSSYHSLGTAKGRLDIGKFMHVVTNDMQSLLKWKSKRIAFGAK